MKSRRDATKIIFEILSICKRGASKTKIVYQVNLNSLLATKYVSVLVRKGLLFRVGDSDGAILFATTETGERLLKVLVNAEKALAGSAPGLFDETPEILV